MLIVIRMFNLIISKHFDIAYIYNGEQMLQPIKLEERYIIKSNTEISIHPQQLNLRTFPQICSSHLNVSMKTRSSMESRYKLNKQKEYPMISRLLAI